MDDNQINKFVSNVLGSAGKLYYKGVFTIDEISSPNLLIKDFNKNYCFAFIFNNLSRNSPASEIGHWLSCMILFNVNNKTLILRFFDSYGNQYIQYGKPLKSYIDNIKLLCLSNRITYVYDSMIHGIQPYNTMHCGIYACYFVIHMFYKPFRKVEMLFSKNGISYKNKVKNNRIMDTYLKKSWPNNFCKENLYQIKIPLNYFFYKYNTNEIGICPKKTYGASKCFKKCMCNYKVKNKKKC